MASVSIVKLSQQQNPPLCFPLTCQQLPLLPLGHHQPDQDQYQDEWGEEGLQINIEEVESDDDKQIKSDKTHSN